MAWVTAEWAGDGPGSIDPAKEVAAARDRVALGISTLDNESVRYDGIDFETKHRQLVKEYQMRREAGLPDPGAVGQSNAPAPEESPEEPPENEPPEPDDNGDDEEIAGLREQLNALRAGLDQAMILLASKSQPINITMPPTTINMPEQKPSDVNIQMEAPVVNVQPADISVTMAPDGRSTKTIYERDPQTQEIISSKTIRE